MLQDLKEVKLYFEWKYALSKDNPFNWMINDLYRGVQTCSNYLVAMGLMNYSEVIGWIILNESKRANGWKCFEEFTKKYIGYTEFTREYWEDIRHGLAHNYYIKDRVGTITQDPKKEHKGVELSDTISIYVNVYFEDFVKGEEKYMDEQDGHKISSDNYSSFYDFNIGNRGFTGPAPPFDFKG